MEIDRHSKELNKLGMKTNANKEDQLDALEKTKVDFRDRVEEIDNWYKEMIHSLQEKIVLLTRETKQTNEKKGTEL